MRARRESTVLYLSGDDGMRKWRAGCFKTNGESNAICT